MRKQISIGAPLHRKIALMLDPITLGINPRACLDKEAT
jgi:hypothetical protein